MGPSVEFAVAIGAGAAFAKAIVAVGVHDSLLLDGRQIVAPRLNRLASLEHETTDASARKFVCTKEPCGATSDDCHPGGGTGLDRMRFTQPWRVSIFNAKRQPEAYGTTAGIDGALLDFQGRKLRDRTSSLLGDQLSEVGVALALIEPQSNAELVRAIRSSHPARLSQPGEWCEAFIALPSSPRSRMGPCDWSRFSWGASPVLGALVACSSAPSVSPPPPNPSPVVRSTQEKAADSARYRHLEDVESDRTEQWVTSQNANARQQLDGLPSRPYFHQKISKYIRTDELGLPWKIKSGDYLYSRKFADRDHRVLVRAASYGVAADERVVLGPQYLVRRRKQEVVGLGAQPRRQAPRLWHFHRWFGLDELADHGSCHGQDASRRAPRTQVGPSHVDDRWAGAVLLRV